MPIAKHGNERMSQALVVQLGGSALSAALTKQPALTSQIFMGVYGAAANVGVLLPYSRTHESEADRIGLVLMAKAGYNPSAAVPFWQRMNKGAEVGRWSFFPPTLLQRHGSRRSRPTCRKP